MNELLARAGALFLAPPALAPPAAASRAEPAPADLVAVLAAPGDLPAIAGGLAADLRHRMRARAALVCRPGPLGPAPALPAARTLARRLAQRDLPAVAAGALCLVALTDGEDARHDAWRAITAAAGYPAVVAFASRTVECDALLRDVDHLLLGVAEDTDPRYTELALASLAELGPRVDRVPVPSGVLARRAAALGLTSVSRRSSGRTGRC